MLRRRTAQRRRDEQPGHREGVFRDLVALPPIFRPSLLWSVLGAVLGWTSGRLFLHAQPPRAFAQVVAEPGRDHWLIARLVAAPDGADGGLALLDRIAREAGARGIVRLHTLIPEQADTLEWWQRAGFTPFRRVLLLVTKAGAGRPLPAGTVRVQEAVDAWAVQRLYEQLTPRPVQYAEARTRGTWSVGRRVGWRVRGFLLVDGIDTLAYCRFRSRGRAHVVEVLAGDAAADIAVGLVAYALGRIARPGDEVLLVLPEEAVALRAAFADAGFQVVERRVWLARYTVRRVRHTLATNDAVSLAALVDARRALYRRDRPNVAVIDRATRC